MLRLTTLGALDLRNRRGRPVHDVLAQPKRVALLTYLALEGHRAPISREKLLALFWPESDEARARNALSQALHHLRQALGAEAIVSQGATAVELRGDELWCDATAFLEALERGEADLALDLYRGEFCPGLAVSGSTEAEQWFEEQRRRLNRLAFDAARARAELWLSRGDADAAARMAKRALAMRPDDEAEVRALLSVLERTGDPGGALRAGEDYARRLRVELEAEVEPATARLLEEIRRRRDAASLAASPLPADDVPRPSPAQGPSAVSVVAPWRWRRAAAVAASAITLVLVGSAATLTWRARHEPVGPARSVAVFPFTVRGPTLDYLHEGMVDLLSAKLEGAAGVRALDPRAVVRAVGSGGALDPAASDRIARRLGAAWYISGDAVEVAGRLQLNGAIYAVGERPQAVATASVTGGSDALFQLVDDLAGRLLAGIMPGRDTALTRLAAVTTQSLPALKAFLDGEQALRAGRDAQAASAFLEAASLDTTFALAQYRLAVMSTWVTIRDAPDPGFWAAKAEHHAERLAPLVRDLLSGYRAYKEVRADESEHLYRGVIASHPDNVEAWLMLGEIYFHYNPLRGRAPMDAWTPFQRVLELDPGNASALLHLERLAALEGRAAEVDSFSRRYLERYPGGDRALDARAQPLFMRADTSGLGEIAREARTADNLVVFSLLQSALLYAQNPQTTIALARALAPRFGPGTGDALAIRTDRAVLSTLGLMMGQWDRDPVPIPPGTSFGAGWRLESQALLASDPLLPLAPARVAALRDSILARRTYQVLIHPLSRTSAVTGAQMQAYLVGIISARLGDLATAQRSVDALASVGDTARGGLAAMLGHAVRADMARARHDYRRALAELDRFALIPEAGRTDLPLHWGVHERFLRAELLYALGRDAEAAAPYESFLNYNDAEFAPIAHLRRAQIHARHGEPEQARFHYGRFLAFWKDCDPELRPLVQQAERELAALGDSTARR